MANTRCCEPDVGADLISTVANTDTRSEWGCQNRAVASARERRNRAGRLVAGAIALAVGIGTLSLDYGGPPRLTTYAERSDLVETVFVAAGLGMALAGLMMSSARPGRRIGDLALVAGMLWFAPAYAGWLTGPPLVQSLGSLATVFVFPVITHLVLAFPNERASLRPARLVVVLAYIEAGLVAIGLAMFWDPFADLGCWPNCTENVFLLRSSPRLADAIQVADLWFVAAAAAALGTICLWRIVTGSKPARRVLLPIAGPGLLFSTAVLTHSVAVLRVPVEDPADSTLLAIFVASCLAVMALAAGLVSDVVRMIAKRRSVARIVANLGEAPAPGSLESALASAVGDPDLRIAYRRSTTDDYVDAAGRSVPDPVDEHDRSLASLVRDGRPVAIVSHSAALPDLERELGAAVRLGIDNERLQAESLSRLEELRASRARIVETGDAVRRRLERDLHDGAQQRLLALSYEIRLARAAAEADGDARAKTQMEEAIAGCQAALDELRELAHGIYPAILNEAGLAAALATLADAAPVPVVIRDAAVGRCPGPVEIAAYLLVSESIGDAADRGADCVTVTTVRDGDGLVVTVEDDGRDRVATLVRLVDRVGALGGTVEVAPTRVRGEIPCG